MQRKQLKPFLKQKQRRRAATSILVVIGVIFISLSYVMFSLNTLKDWKNNPYNNFKKESLELKESYERDVQELKLAYSNDIEKLEHTYEKDIDAIEKMHAASVDNVDKVHQKNFENMQNLYDERLDKVEDILKETKKQNEKTLNAITGFAIEDWQDRKFKLYMEETRKLAEAYQSNVKGLQKFYETRLDRVEDLLEENQEQNKDTKTMLSRFEKISKSIAITPEQKERKKAKYRFLNTMMKTNAGGILVILANPEKCLRRNF